MPILTVIIFESKNELVTKLTGKAENYKLFMLDSIGLRLENYTLKQKQEVLLISLETSSGEEDVVVIFAGFSSSLMRETAFDPDIPVIAPDSKIISIDRLASPYNPDKPEYIDSQLTWSAMEDILQKANL